MKNQRFRLWFMLLVLVLLVALMVWLVDWRLVWKQLQSADLLKLVEALAALILGQLLFVQRWRSLIGSRVSYRNVFDSANVGQMLNVLIPLRPGEPARILLLNRMSGIPLAQVTSSVLVERWFEQLMRLLTLVGAVAFGSGLQISAGSVFGALGFLIVVMAFIVLLLGHQHQAITYGSRWLSILPGVDQARAAKLILGLLQGLAGFSSPGRLMIGFSLSLLTWGCFFFYQLFVLQALNLPFSLSQQLSLSLAGLALSPPSAPTQPGLYHASILAPLRLLGYPVEELTAWTVVLHVLQMITIIPLGIWGVGRSGFSFRQLIRAGKSSEKNQTGEILEVD